MQVWIAAETAYHDKISHVEHHLISNLRGLLSSCRNATDMFHVFSKYNSLFIRPKIRGAVNEYQNKLIENVKNDIHKLQEKFKIRYQNTEANKSFILRDIPPAAGAALWAKQIEKQLNVYMKRVEDVLGSDWGLYSDGAKLKAESTAFRRLLESASSIHTWLTEITQKDVGISGNVFEIKKNRALGGKLELDICFDLQTITIFKEVRTLLWNNYQIPHAVSNLAKDAKRIYPFAMALRETVQMYFQLDQEMNRTPFLINLFAGYRNNIHGLLTRGIQLKWDHFLNALEIRSSRPFSITNSSDGKYLLFVKEFYQSVSILQDKYNMTVSINDEIEKTLQDLAHCPFRKTTFQSYIDKIQTLVCQFPNQTLTFFSSILVSYYVTVSFISFTYLFVLYPNFSLIIYRWTN